MNTLQNTLLLLFIVFALVAIACGGEDGGQSKTGGGDQAPVANLIEAAPPQPTVDTSDWQCENGCEIIAR